MPLLPPNESFESLPPPVSRSSRKKEKRKKEQKRERKEKKKERKRLQTQGSIVEHQGDLLEAAKQTNKQERKRKERIKEREKKEKATRNEEKTDRRAKKAAEWLWALRNGGLSVTTKEVMKAVGFKNDEVHKGSYERKNVDRKYDNIAKERCILVVLEDQETSTAGFISFLTSRQSIYYSPIHLYWIALRMRIRDAMIERVWAANYLIPGTRILLSTGMYRQRCFYVSMKGRPRNPGVQGILMATSQTDEDEWEELHKRLRRTGT